MRIIKDIIDDDIFIDLIVDMKDLMDLQEQSLEPCQVEICGKMISMWIRTATQREIDHFLNWENDD